MTTGRINQIALGFVQISQLTPPHYFRPRGPSAQGEGIGKVVTFKLGYVRSVSFLQPVSVRKERHRESERVHTDDSQNRTGRYASVRHSIVAHSLFPSPNTSLKEIMTSSQGALFTRRRWSQVLCLRFRFEGYST